MSYNPTDQQQDIIAEKNKGIIVSASAGSGKTSTMIARIIDLIKNKHADVKRLLVLTFTNLSASDMRVKLVEALEGEVNAGKLSAESLFEVARSNICTIDSFCQTLVRKYCFEVGVDPNFSVLDETASTLLKERAFSDLIIKLWLKKDKKTISLINSFSEHRKLDDLKDIVFKLYNNFCVTKNSADILNKTKLSFNSDLSKNISAKSYGEFVCDFASDVLAEISEINKSLMHKEVIDKLNQIKNCVALLATADINTLIKNAKIFKATFPRKKTPKEQLAKAESEFVYKIIEDEIDDLKEIAGFLTSETLFNNTVLLTAKNSAENIFDLTTQFKEAYYNLKQTRYALDFSDIEELALKILENPQIKSVVAGEFDYVFIDEYQDINLMQSELLSNISKEGVFAVGDAKQSIYVFRLTSPEIFMESFNSALAKQSKVKAKILTQNFRSEQPILRFVNFVFEKIMTQKTSGMDYDNNAKFDVLENLNNCCVPVSINIINKNDQKQPLKQTYSVMNDQGALNAGEPEGEVVANIIKSALTKGYTEGDIVLLCRSRTKKVVNIYKQLMGLGFNVNLNFDFDVKEASETTSLNNFLYLISNYKSDVYLFSVLTDFYGLTFDESVLIKSEFKNEKFFNTAAYLFAVQFAASAEKQKATVAQKINNFLADLSSLSLYSENTTVYNVAKKIVQKFDVYKKCAFNPNANFANIDRFLNELEKLDISLAEYAALTLNTSYKIKMASSQSNAISITTIHASKGLEYKVVILIDAGKKYNTTDLNKKVLIDNSLGIALNGIDAENETVADTISRLSAAKVKYKKLFADELRLLYVALTRAEKELYVVGSATLDEYARSNYKLKKCTNYIDLILASLPENKFLQLKENGCTQLKHNGVVFAEFNYLNSIETTAPVSPYILPVSKKEDEDKLKHLLVEDEPQKPQVLKNTVTRILEGENQNKLYASLSFSEDEKAASILRGNAYHKFFEHFNANAKNLEAEASAVFNALTSAEKSLIDYKHIEGFLNSPLINLIKNKTVCKEQKFVYKTTARELGGSSNSEVLLQGIIDCLMVEDDGITIIDYKTSHRNEKDLINTYKTQLALYGQAMAQILNKNVKKTYIYSVFNSKLIEII